jgi:hypothetical protein
MMRHFFRPPVLIALSAAVVVGAIIVVFQGPPGQGRPTPLPVSPEEVEIVWLYAATNANSWERFVAAVKRTADRLQGDHSGLQADTNAAFPQQTTAVPEVSLSWSGPGPRFVFRWYKLTSDWKVRDWIEALLKRRPPPLAIIGGSSSDNARELALYLNQYAGELPEADRPLLLLTQATAYRVAAPESTGTSDPQGGETSLPSRGVPLTRLYPGRTFRFCFTNLQMATAVTDFLWWQPDLRPDRDPVYMTQWDDDSYSRDLVGAFWDALRLLMAKSLANEWAWLYGSFASGLWPSLHPFGCFGTGIYPADRLPLNPFDDAAKGSLFCLAVPPTPQVIDSSVGGYGTPNRYEAKVARDLLDLLQNQQEPQKRPLLILTGQSQPSRRFLRALIRLVPDLAGRFVIASGDAISFNTVYRDRQVAWDIQDLPFPLVFFCHRNPVDRNAGFRPRTDRPDRAEPDDPNHTATTGTEDVLLYADIVEALFQAGSPVDERPCANAAELAQRLSQARLLDERIVMGSEGIPLFGKDGHRLSGTGEHVVCLRPAWNEFHDRLLPEAAIEVWEWRRRDWNRGERGQHWQRCGEPLHVSYSDAPAEGGERDGH